MLTMDPISRRLVEGAEFPLSVSLELEDFTDVEIVVELSWKYASRLSSGDPSIKIFMQTHTCLIVAPVPKPIPL